MRIACLQFAPQVGEIDNNLDRADAVLRKADPKDLDLLVLPELAFTGYNFKSLQSISPYLEPTASGISTLWAKSTALKYNCVVTVGYPETVDVSAKWPASPEYYNSAITVDRNGQTIANYRKSHLYYTDETWALEGTDGFYEGHVEHLGADVAMGICMDINPYKFEAPWSKWEFAFHVLRCEANLVILSMAWLTREDARSFNATPKELDMETLSYWLARLEPIIRADMDKEIIVVVANRSGVEDDAVYAGTSAVLGIQAGEVKVYGALGRGQRELLVVDTDKEPQAKLVARSSASMHARMDSNGLEGTEEPDENELFADEDAALHDVPPLSPVEARFGHSYFSSEPVAADEVKNLHSSVDRKDTPMQSTPPVNKPNSPVLRNLSTAGLPVIHEPETSAGEIHNSRNVSDQRSVTAPLANGEAESEAKPNELMKNLRAFNPDTEGIGTNARPKSTVW